MENIFYCIRVGLLIWLKAEIHHGLFWTVMTAGFLHGIQMYISYIAIKMLAFYKISRELAMNGLDTTVTQQKMSKLRV